LRAFALDLFFASTRDLARDTLTPAPRAFSVLLLMITHFRLYL